MTRLSAATLGTLPATFETPRYDRAQVKTGVVHLGLGAFHRAHQATFFDDALAAGDPRWGILGVSNRSAEPGRNLAAQDGLYTVVARDGDAIAPRVIGASRGVMVLADGAAPVIVAIAAPETHIVTLTITEKGYRLRPGGGGLDPDDPGIRHDIASPQTPETIPGLLVAALARRKATVATGLNVISCDNLPANGARLREAVLTMAREVDPALHDWIAAQIAFPSTMVDRIVPATTQDDIATFADQTGVTDTAMVKTEPFRQWVIESVLTADVPDFARFGVTLTRDVTAWELTKLRMLNAAHSTMAFCGLLAGFTFVHEVIATGPGRRIVEDLWDENQTTLRATEGLDVAAYRAATLARFANTALHHKLIQIAADGSQKVPPRIIAPLGERLARGMASPVLLCALAAWLVCLTDGPGAARPIILQDPRAEALRGLMHGETRQQVGALVSRSGLFEAPVFGGDAFQSALASEIDRLRRDPAAALSL